MAASFPATGVHLVGDWVINDGARDTFVATMAEVSGSNGSCWLAALTCSCAQMNEVVLTVPGCQNHGGGIKGNLMHTFGTWENGECDPHSSGFSTLNLLSRLPKQQCNPSWLTLRRLQSSFSDLLRMGISSPAILCAHQRMWTPFIRRCLSLALTCTHACRGRTCANTWYPCEKRS